MKRLFILFLTALLLCPAADSYARGVCAAAGAGGSAALVEYCATCTGTCVYCEDFGGTTDCDAGAETEALYCRYGYTITTTGATWTWNNNNTTAQCSGSSNIYDLSLTGDGNAAIAIYDMSATAEISMVINVLIPDLPGLSANTGALVFDVATASGSLECFRLWVYNDSGTYKWRLMYRSNAGADVYVLGPEISTSVYAKHRIYWKTNQSGTGITWSVNGSNYLTDGTTANRTPVRIRYYSNQSSSVYRYDSVRIESGSTPPTCN